MWRTAVGVEVWLLVSARHRYTVIRSGWLTYDMMGRLVSVQVVPAVEMPIHECHESGVTTHEIYQARYVVLKSDRYDSSCSA